MSDLRFAFRQLLKNPGFSAVAVLTLALGIGANTAMFSVINAVLFRPLPFADPERLVAVWQQYPKRAWSQETFSLGNFLDLRHHTNVFADAGAYSLSAHTLTGVDEPVRLNTVRMSASLLPTLGVRLAHGRNFTSEEDQDRPESPRVVLLSDHVWRQRFQADPAVIGRTLRLNDEWAVPIIGILPKNFRLGAENPDLCLPLRLDPAKVGRGQRGLQVIARLQPGAKAEQLPARLGVIAAQLRAADPWANGDLDLSVVPLHHQIVGGVRLVLLVLGGAVAGVLLIACTNIANLSLARSLSRQPEMTIRAAMGAGRWRIIRQLLLESLVLGLLGGGLGLILGKLTVELAENFLLTRLPQLVEIRLDPAVLSFTFGASLLSAIFFGIFPALAASRVNLTDSLKEGAKGTTSGIARHQLRGALVVAEVCLAFVLLTGAGLLLKSLERLRDVNPGFDPARMLTVQTTLAGKRYTDNNATRLAAVREVAFRFENLPGVESVTTGTSLPLASEMDLSGTAIDGRTFRANEYPFTHMRGVRANYFEVLRVPLLEGRHLADADNEIAQKVAVINSTMARQYWPNESALGKRIRPDALQTQEWLTIVGVVADIKNESLAQRPRPEIYYPYAQFPTRGLSVIIRTKVPPLSLSETVRREIRKVDGTLALTALQTMEQTMADTSSNAAFQSWLLAAFAGLALLLAATGIYGVLSCAVSQRSREIGIRLALGAQPRSVYALILGRGMKFVLLGMAIGLVAAFALARFIGRMLFDVSPADPATYVTAFLVLGSAALAACFMPARRAANVDPMEALRRD